MSYPLGASYFVDGTNSLRFTHTDTFGYQINSSNVSFAGAPQPLTCDADADGQTNVVDVQLGVNLALGARSCTADLNQDGSCNVVDVQRIVNAGLGGTYRVGG